jgi:hypothetical protein
MKRYYIVVSASRTAISWVVVVIGVLELAAAQAPPPEPAPAIPLLPAEQVWLRSLPSPPAAGGAMTARFVYVPLRHGAVLALDRETGDDAWMRPLESVVAPVAVGDTLLVATPTQLHALQPLSGEPRWSAALAEPLSGPPRVGNGLIVVVSKSGAVRSLRLTDGTLAWEHALASAPLTPAIGHDGTVYVALADGRLVALEAESGMLRWEQQLTGSLSEPFAAPDRVFVGSTDNYFYALDDRTGDLRWKWRAGGDIVAITGDRDAVYFAALDNLVRALNRSNGNQRWRRTTVGRPFPSLQLLARTLVVSDLSPAITALDARAGAEQGTLASPGDLADGPLIELPTSATAVSIVLLTLDGRVAAYRSTGAAGRAGGAGPAAGAPPATPAPSIP